MPSPPDLAIEATGLVKTFGAVRPVDGVDLAVPAGSVYAVLGPNGAGKTTTIRMLATLLRPDAGTARVCGHDVVRDPGAVRARISLTGQYASLDEDLTGQENLTLLARLRGYPRAAAAARASELLDAFTLAESASRQVKNYSGGLRRRLDIAASLIITPDALLMKAPAAVLGVTQAVLYPLAFFSNIFIEPSTLPGWLEAFVHVNPVTHLVTATRALMDGTATPGHIGYVLEASAILTAVFAPVSLGLYRAT